MENAKGKILKNIKRSEIELKLEELSEYEMSEKISRYKSLSMKLCEQIQTISWKISQADFINCCEDKKRSNYLLKIERSNLITRKFEIPKRSERGPNIIAEPMESLSARLEDLKRTNAKKRESISNIEKEFDAIKKRDNAILEKLANDIEELENEERQLEDKLEQIHCYNEKDDFDFDSKSTSNETSGSRTFPSDTVVETSENLNNSSVIYS